MLTTHELLHLDAAADDNPDNEAILSEIESIKESGVYPTDRPHYIHDYLEDIN